MRNICAMLAKFLVPGISGYQEKLYNVISGWLSWLVWLSGMSNSTHDYVSELSSYMHKFSFELHKFSFA